MSTSINRLPDDILTALKRCDELCNIEQLDLFYNLYDPKTGGFYYSISSRDTEEMTPFAEGTSFVLEALGYGGIEIPDWEKKKVSEWILNHQDEADGFFYEDLWGKITSGPRLNRDLNYSVNILKKCDVSPKYPLPVERIKSKDTNSTIPAYLNSESAMLDYLNSLDFSAKGIWLTGQRLSTASTLIHGAGYGKIVKDYLLTKINPETGLFGDGLSWSNTNGSMKLSGFFDADFPFPNVGRAIDSVIKIFETCPPPSVSTHIWNPFVFLNRAIQSNGDDKELARALLFNKGAEIISLAVDCALKLKKPDGGFSSDPSKALKRQQGYLFGLGLPDESDLDGTLIAGPRLRNSIYSLFGVSAPGEYYKEYENDFWKKCKNKAPIIKKFPKPDEPLEPIKKA